MIGLGMITAVFFIGTSVYAAPVLESGIPGVGAGGARGAVLPSLPTYINYLYIFVLGLVGIAGFISLVIWGTVWVGSAVVDKKAMAMERIKTTFIGIGIALTAYIMLNTINPDLAIIKVPTASKLIVATSTQSLIFTGSSELIKDGALCAPLTQCYPGSTCEGSIQDANGKTTTMGTCKRVATGIANNWESSCAVMDTSSTTCVKNAGCKYCAMPDNSKRCINKNNSYTNFCTK